MLHVPTRGAGLLQETEDVRSKVFKEYLYMAFRK